MRIIDPFIQEFEQEAALTRKALERVPEDQYAWQPHPKSMALGRLAAHLAENPGWAATILQADELVLDAQMTAATATSSAELLKFFDEGVAQALAVMQQATDEQMRAHWRMKDAEGRVLLDMPRAALFRNFIINHTVHHRGQLSVYLRLLDVPVPAIYGPSGDEQ